MKRIMVTIVGGGLVIALSGCVVVPAGPPGHAKEHRGAVVMAPAPIVIAPRPRMVFVTEFGVSFAPDLEFDVYEVGGIWYSYRSKVWYRAGGYNGPWVVVKHGHLPKALVKVKPGQVRKFHAENQGKKDRGQKHNGKGKKND